MQYELDTELAPILAARAEQAASVPIPERGDWQTMRANGNQAMAKIADLVPASESVSTDNYTLTTPTGAAIRLRWYTKDGSCPGSAVVYAHGGGMVMGTLDAYDTLLSMYAAVTGVPFLSVDYRLAPEVTGTALAEDVFAGIVWLVHNARRLGVDPARIAVMGDSGGGGPAAGAAILARDRGVSLKRQILIYPMLDDRTIEPDPARAPFLTWSYDNNYTAWTAVLGEQRGAEDVSPVAAPARLSNFADLPPTYLDVGDLDIFRDEGIAYAQQLAKAGVPIELHVHPGAPHGWERFAPHSAVGQRALTDRTRVISRL